MQLKTKELMVVGGALFAGVASALASTKFYSPPPPRVRS